MLPKIVKIILALLLAASCSNQPNYQKNVKESTSKSVAAVASVVGEGANQIKSSAKDSSSYILSLTGKGSSESKNENKLSSEDSEENENSPSLLKGVVAPHYALAKGKGQGIKLLDITRNGAALIEINLVCKDSFDINYACKNQAHHDLYYWLVDAKDSDGPGDNGKNYTDGITFGELEALSNGTKGIDLKHQVEGENAKIDVDKEQVGEQGGLSIVVEGPSTIDQHKELFFVLRYEDPDGGKSFLYFDINID